MANGASKNVGLGKFWQNLENSEAFLTSLEISFLHGLFIQWTPDNSNLRGKSKKVRVIGSSSYREFEKIAENKIKNSFYCTVNLLITFNCRNVK